jgi:hypothetical protein
MCSFSFLKKKKKRTNVDKREHWSVTSFNVCGREEKKKKEIKGQQIS